MNLFGFNIHISKSQARAVVPSGQRSLPSVTPEQWLRGEDLGTGPSLSNAYEQVVWVYRAINVLAEQAANIPFVFSAGERGRENLITSGPLLDFYSRPHPHLNRFQSARDLGHSVVLAGTKTKPSDATLDDLRALRRNVNKAALNGRISAYYLDSTWETRLPAFRTSAEPNVYQRLPDGTAMLDGYPIVWTDVLEPYGTAAAADKAIAVFGALSFWWMGEHGTPRIDTSEHVWFANDQLAVRFIEEIDFDFAAGDATAALITAAS
jgi:hypothetical protein